MSVIARPVRVRGRVVRVDRRDWTVTTHEWARDVDRDHLADARHEAHLLGERLAVHLVLEVLAYADDEACAAGRRGAVVVTVRERSVAVADDGRGTDTRRGEGGRPVRKPVMATRDVRFYDAGCPPLLADGLPRRGMSLVAAASPRLTHTNHRPDGSWRQVYRHGVPDGPIVELSGRGARGTVVALDLPQG